MRILHYILVVQFTNVRISVPLYMLKGDSMAKLNKGRQLVIQFKSKESEEEKTNLTFRMPRKLIKEFKDTCKGQELSANTVAEELFRQFYADLK
jgi:hypothetical protein